MNRSKHAQCSGAGIELNDPPTFHAAALTTKDVQIKVSLHLVRYWLQIYLLHFRLWAVSIYMLAFNRFEAALRCACIYLEINTVL